jgi:hypothetical protein
MLKIQKRNVPDLIGVATSSLCLIHCIAMPVLIALGAGYFSHAYIKYAFLLISFFSIYRATEKNSFQKQHLLLWAAFWGFLMSNLFHEEYTCLVYTEYFFALLIIVGHVLNIRYCKTCVVDQEDENKVEENERL